MTEHTALYRKYRPQTFADVAGQEQVTDVLQAALQNKTIAHAYLFYGTRGTGKTTIARIFAKALGTTHKDLYEMDAASNRRVEDFRELNDSTATLPFESPYKVYIIDEAHMLTKEAFNAFLKTLEEPPAHVVFILATTEPEKLPDTIVSRCQTFAFNTPTPQVLTKVISAVAQKEGYTLQHGAAELIAILADGSFRDALGVLQKVLTISTDTSVDVAEVEQVTSAPNTTLVRSIVQALFAKDLDAALSAVRSAQHSNMVVLLTLLLQRVRAVLLVRYNKSAQETIAKEFSEEDVALIQQCAHDPAKNISSATLRALVQAHIETYRAYIPSVPLELALIELLEQKNNE